MRWAERIRRQTCSLAFFNQRYEVRAGIDNLFDSEPEVFGAAFSAANPISNNNALGSSPRTTPSSGGFSSG